MYYFHLAQIDLCKRMEKGVYAMVLDMLKKELIALWRPLLIVAEINMLFALFISYLFPIVSIFSGIALLFFAIQNEIKSGHWERFYEHNLPLNNLVLEKYLFVLLVMVGQLIIYAAGFQIMIYYRGDIPRIPYIFIGIFLFDEMVFLSVFLHRYFIKGPRVVNKSFYDAFIFEVFISVFVIFFIYCIDAVIHFFFVIFGFENEGISQYFNNYPANTVILSTGVFVTTYFLSKRNIMKFDFFSLNEVMTPQRQGPVKYLRLWSSIDLFANTVQPYDKDDVQLAPVSVRDKEWEARSLNATPRKKHPIFDKIIIFVGLLYIVFAIFLIAS
jgi:hypothetical protein